MAADRRRMVKPDMAEAAARLAILRPYIEGEATLTSVAGNAGIPLRTAERWMACYHKDGPIGLTRSERADAGARKLSAELVSLIEGLALNQAEIILCHYSSARWRNNTRTELAGTVL